MSLWREGACAMDKSAVPLRVILAAGFMVNRDSHHLDCCHAEMHFSFLKASTGDGDESVENSSTEKSIGE